MVGEAASPLPVLADEGWGKQGGGEERLGTFLLGQTMLLSPCQALAGLLQRIPRGQPAPRQLHGDTGEAGARLVCCDQGELGLGKGQG